MHISRSNASRFARFTMLYITHGRELRSHTRSERERTRQVFFNVPKIRHHFANLKIVSLPPAESLCVNQVSLEHQKKKQSSLLQHTLLAVSSRKSLERAMNMCKNILRIFFHVLSVLIVGGSC